MPSGPGAKKAASGRIASAARRSGRGGSMTDAQIGGARTGKRKASAGKAKPAPKAKPAQAKAAHSPAPEAAKAAAAPPASEPNLFEQLAPGQREALEKLSVNL